VSDERQWPTIALAVSVTFLGSVAEALGSEEKARQPWQERYTGPEATGKQVIALWQFDAGAETKDASGRGLTLRLRGRSRFVKDGRFGVCLRCFAASSRQAEGAVTVEHANDLSPAGAFTLELWIRPRLEMRDSTLAFLLDNKYIHYQREGNQRQHNSGYVFFLRKVGHQGQWEPTVLLGFGEGSERYRAETPVTLTPDTWYHLAFCYDGVGTGRIYLNGKDIGGAILKGRGDIAPAKYPLTIGARVSSNHIGFAGDIDQVRVSRGIAMGSLSIGIGRTDGRTARVRAFLRMAKDVRVPIHLMNYTGKALSDARVHVSLDGERVVPLPDLAPKQTHTIDVPVDTALRPGRYRLEVTAAANAGDRTFEATQSVPIVIVPRPLSHRMPVVMWGTRGSCETLKEIGFTHHFRYFDDFPRVWEAGQPVGPEHYAEADDLRECLHEHLAQGVGVVALVLPDRWANRKKECQRVDRRGQPYNRLCASLPEVQAFGYNCGASIANVFGHLPALQAALIHTECRDGTNVCFHAHDREAFRDYAGYAVPEQIISKRPKPYSQIKGFPRNRIVSDDDPILTYYRWFWKKGDGWNSLHTQVHRGLKSTGRDDLWTFFDPAVRVPSVWGSGGGVDVISHWTYTYPDPIKIGQTTDELLAMAHGAPQGQKVMKQTQLIWRRSRTAPQLPKDKSDYAQWEGDLPEATYITIAPDHLREAFWSKIARPISGIMYHGWPSLVRLKTPRGYSFTNSEARAAIAELTRDVVRPLGPTLVQVPDRRSDVAVLQSFASQVFAGRGTWGWGESWEADVHLVLQWAQIQPQIVYDETVLRDGLDGFRVLVMPACDVLTEEVAGKVAQFQDRGGLIVADEYLAPAIYPDILVQRYQRTGRADRDKAALVAKAGDLRRELGAFYRRYGQSSDPDAVVRFRQYRSTDYLFAVNDKRTFGRYVGHHGLVMEKGLPHSVTLSVGRKVGQVYDLVTHKPVAVTRTAEGIEFEATFAPGGGRLFMITDTEIADVVINAPTSVRQSTRVALEIAVVDGRKAPLPSVVPVQVTILDPQSRPAERSGYYGAKDGTLSIELNLARNDLPGPWIIRATELASGLSREHRFTVGQGR